MVHDVKEQSSDDTEMQRLNEMMDKLIAIQHPEAAKDTAKKPVQQKETLVVSATDTLPVHSGFYSLEEDNKVAVSNVIRASIPETQTIVAGSTVKLLLLQDVTIKGRTIPSNTFVYGTASLSNERLKIAITSLRAGNSILPVSLEVFDMDGLVGIYVPGSINRDVAKQSTEEAVSGMGLTTLDPSIGAQAASAGIQAAKSLIGKKVRLIKVTVRAGYQILLQQIN